MKVHHNERLADMTRYLSNYPYKLISLTNSVERYEPAKPSIDEDLGVIKKTSKGRGYGASETIPGTVGGVLFILEISYEEARKYIESLAGRLSEQDRLLPGGYAYLSDLLKEPELLRQVGGITVSKYLSEKINTVMTVATKGVPITQTVSYYLNVPLVIVRRDLKITEGSTVGINYMSGSSERIEKMELFKRDLECDLRVFVVDDPMRGGRTVNGMRGLIEEFEPELVGIIVFAKLKLNGHYAIDGYTSLSYAKDVDVQTKNVTVVPGGYFSEQEVTKRSLSFE